MCVTDPKILHVCFFLDPQGEDSVQSAIPDQRQVAVNPEPAGMVGAVCGKLLL